MLLISEEDQERGDDATMMPVNGDIDDEKGASNQEEDMEEGKGDESKLFSTLAIFSWDWPKFLVNVFSIHQIKLLQVSLGIMYMFIDYTLTSITT